MPRKQSRSKRNAGVVRLDGRPTRALSLNYEIEKQRQAMCRDTEAIFFNGFKLAREQTFKPLEFLFILKEKSTSIFKYAGNGEMMARFENGEPLTTDKPRLKTKFQKDMTVVNVGDNPEVDLLTSHKIPGDVSPIAVGKRDTIAEEQNQTLETLDTGLHRHSDNSNCMQAVPKPSKRVSGVTYRGRGGGRGAAKGRVILPSISRSASRQSPPEDYNDQSTGGTPSTSALPDSPQNVGDSSSESDEEITRIPVALSKRDFNGKTTLWDQLEELEDEELTETIDSLNPVMSGSYLNATEGELPHPLLLDGNRKLYPVPPVKSEPLTEGFDSHLTGHQMTSVMTLAEVKREPALCDVAVPVAIVQYGRCQNRPELPSDVAVRPETPKDAHVSAVTDGLSIMMTDDGSRLSTNLEEPLPDDTLEVVENEDLSLGEIHCQSFSLHNNIDEPFPMTLYNEHTAVSREGPAKTETRDLDTENLEKTLKDREISSVHTRRSSSRTVSKQMGSQTAGSRKKHSVNPSTSKIVTARQSGTLMRENLYIFSPENYDCSKTFERGKHKTAQAQREKNYKCLVCNYRTVEKYYIEQHVRTHTGEKPHKCPVCVYRSAAKSTMIDHIRAHAGIKPNKCSLCDMKFAKKSTLTVHMRKHTGEKPFKCSQCDYRCSRKPSLIPHMRIHTGEKPYMCHLCQKKFMQKTQLVRHIRAHTGEKPYACSMCNYSSASNCGLRSHMRRHTKEKPHMCSLCGLRFSCESNFIKHTKKRHGPKP